MDTPSDEIGLYTKLILKANRMQFSTHDVLFVSSSLISLITYITIFAIVGPESIFTFSATPSIPFLQILTWVYFISTSGAITYSAYRLYYNRPFELIFSLISLLIGIVVRVMFTWLMSFTWSSVVLQMIGLFGVLIDIFVYNINWNSWIGEIAGFWHWIFTIVIATYFMILFMEYKFVAVVVGCRCCWVFLFQGKAWRNGYGNSTSFLIDEDGNKSVAAVVHT